MSAEEVNVTIEYQSCQCLEETQGSGFLQIFFLTAKETLSREEFCESAVMPDFMIPGNNYLLSKEKNISNPTKTGSILCRPAK